MINTYHHLDEPVELMKNIIPSLKANGRLAIIEHDPAKVLYAGSHVTAKELLLKQADQAGFELEQILTFLKRDNIYVFRVKK